MGYSQTIESVSYAKWSSYTATPVEDIQKFIAGYIKAYSSSPVGILLKMLPALNATANCPVFLSTSSCFFAADLQTVIIHLNDHHKWTREQIADWLETLDLDLSFRVG